MTVTLNPQRLHLARNLRAKQMTWKDTAEIIGCSLETLKGALVPGYRERRAARAKEYRFSPRKRKSCAGVHKAPGFSAGHLSRVEPPESVLEERERAASAPRSLTARTFGDPTFERSALYGKLKS